MKDDNEDKPIWRLNHGPELSPEETRRAIALMGLLYLVLIAEIILSSK